MRGQAVVAGIFFSCGRQTNTAEGDDSTENGQDQNRNNNSQHHVSFPFDFNSYLGITAYSAEKEKAVV